MIQLGKLILIFLLVSFYSCASNQQVSYQPLTTQQVTLEENPFAFYEQAVLHGENVDQQALILALKRLMEPQEATTAVLQHRRIAAAESLHQLGAISETELHHFYAQFAAFIADTASPGAALAMVDQFFNLSLIKEDKIINYFFNLAINHLSLGPLAALTKEMDRRGLDSSAATALLKTQPQSQWMKGTVMVYLEKGFKRQGPISVPQVELGSGFFIDRQGYLITNYHVISSMVDPKYRGPAKLSVQVWNSVGERLPATVVGYSEVTDLALLKVAYQPDYVFSFNPQALTIGETVYALGSPAGFSFSLTRGLVSNASRALMPIGDIIQIDAAVNPGNSGGPLVDEKGEVRGVVFAGIPQFEGLNFALPADMVLALLPKLTFKGAARLPFLTLALYDWGNNNLEVTFVPNAQTLSTTGLVVGSTLRAIGGTPATTRVALQKQLLKRQPHSLTTIEWTTPNNNNPQQALVLLKERPAILETALLRHHTLSQFYAPLFGLSVQAMSNRQFLITKVYPGLSGSQHNFNRNDTFAFIRRERTQLDDQLLAIRIISISRQMGVIEGGQGLLLYSPFDNGSWL